MAARDPRANYNCGRCPSLFIRPNHVTCEASQNKRLAQRVYATGRDRSRVNPTIIDSDFKFLSRIRLYWMNMLYVHFSGG